MNLRHILNIIKKRIHLLSIITIFCILFTVVLSTFIIKPSYKSTILVCIGNNEIGAKINNSDFLLYKELVDTYGKLATSSVVSNDIILNTNLNLSENVLLSHISYESITSTQFLKLIVQSKDKNEVEIVSKQLPESLKNACSEINKNKFSNILFIDSPTPPFSASKNTFILYIMISFIFGIFLSLGIIFFIEYFDNTIRSEDELSKLLNTNNIISISLSKN